MAILKLKMKGEAVRLLQQQLMKIGYPPMNEIDFGVVTEKVVKDFQTTNGLFPDGQVGPITQGVLDAQLAMPVLQGIDVSEWNGLIDWNKVAKTPYQFF